MKTPDTHRHDHYSLSEHPWGVTPRILDTKCYCAAVALIPNRKDARSRCRVVFH